MRLHIYVIKYVMTQIIYIYNYIFTQQINKYVYNYIHIYIK